MAFKISKADQQRIDGLITKFADAKQTVEAAFATLNEVRDELRGRIEDIADEMQGEYDDMSERWQEGDRASPTQDWIEQLGDFAYAIEDEIEMPDLSDMVSKLEEGVPSEPDY